MDFNVAKLWTQLSLQAFSEQAFRAVYGFVADPWVALQVAVITIVVGFGYLWSKVLAKRLDRFLEKNSARKHEGVHYSLVYLRQNVYPLFVLVIIYLIDKVFKAYGWSHFLFHIIATLLFAWILIRGLSVFIDNKSLSRNIAFFVWGIAALETFHLYDPLIVILDKLAVTIGGLKISIYLVLKSIVILAAFIWIARYVSQIMERFIQNSQSFSPSVKVLFAKISNVTLIGTAIFIGVGSLGIDLTAIAFFSGAVGVGVGFGLQKVVSNIISGIILLLDESIKPGDVIEVGDKYGWIESLSARYVSVKVYDGTEHLIPNEDMITNKVINWSHSNNLVLVTVNFGVSYNTDIRIIPDMILKAIEGTARVLTYPAPGCFLLNFGDSSVDFRLGFWINDPKNGMLSVKSEVMFRIWDALKANNIEIPFPQRDVHLKQTSPIEG